jgi:hypothetical protein
MNAATIPRWTSSGVSVEGCLTHTAAGPRGEHLRGVGGPAQDGPDLDERELEHVVQDERESLGRAEGVEHHEQRQSDRVGEQRLVLRAYGPVRHEEGVGPVEAVRRLPRRASAPQRVQAQAGHDRGQPAAQVVDPVGVAAAQPDPRLLDGVLGVVEAAEDPEGEGAQAWTVGPELQGEIVGPAHRPLHGDGSGRWALIGMGCQDSSSWDCGDGLGTRTRRTGTEAAWVGLWPHQPPGTCFTASLTVFHSPTNAMLTRMAATCTSE